MNVKFGFIKHGYYIDDIYLLPTLALATYKSDKGNGFAIGIKFLKLCFAIRFIRLTEQTK